MSDSWEDELTCVHRQSDEHMMTIVKHEFDVDNVVQKCGDVPQSTTLSDKNEWDVPFVKKETTFWSDTDVNDFRKCSKSNEVRNDIPVTKCEPHLRAKNLEESLPTGETGLSLEERDARLWVAREMCLVPGGTDISESNEMHNEISITKHEPCWDEEYTDAIRPAEDTGVFVVKEQSKFAHGMKLNCAKDSSHKSEDNESRDNISVCVTKQEPCWSEEYRHVIQPAEYTGVTVVKEELKCSDDMELNIAKNSSKNSKDIEIGGNFSITKHELCRSRLAFQEIHSTVVKDGLLPQDDLHECDECSSVISDNTEVSDVSITKHEICWNEEDLQVNIIEEEGVCNFGETLRSGVPVSKEAEKYANNLKHGTPECIKDGEISNQDNKIRAVVTEDSLEVVKHKSSSEDKGKGQPVTEGHLHKEMKDFMAEVHRSVNLTGDALVMALHYAKIRSYELDRRATEAAMRADSAKRRADTLEKLACKTKRRVCRKR